MKKILTIAAIMLMGFKNILYAGFQWDTSITKLENKDEYLVRFKIDKVLENREIAEFTAPQLQCTLGEESVVTKTVQGNGYIVKALIRENVGKTIAHISVVIHENNETIYSATEEYPIEL